MSRLLYHSFRQKFSFFYILNFAIILIVEFHEPFYATYKQKRDAMTIHKEFNQLCTKPIPQTVLFVAVLATFLFHFDAISQPAQGANKFLGNITTFNQVRTDFSKYWNQITGENESKWSSIEGTKDKMNWGGTDNIAKYAKENGIPWKFHTLIWGSQYPNWMNSLSQSEQLKQITEWYDAVAERYPDVQMIDVVNEAYPSHAPAPFKNALGGDGSTGFDWIIKSFQMARERWPKAILIYNDYNNIEYNNEVNWTVNLVQAMLKAKAPIDAIGCQAHDAYKISTNTVKNNIDKLAATGLPIFITEYDIGETNDASQKRIMEEQFTMFWNHPKIVGITYWGYVVGRTWRNGTGLLNTNGTERPALTWLIDYVKKNPNPPNDFKDMLKIDPVSIKAHNQPFTFNADQNRNRGFVEIFNLQGKRTGSYYINQQTAPVLQMIPSSGCYVVRKTGHQTNIVNKIR